ncbi:MAG: hypothetical protein U1C71_01790, partial [archaeon]|nr:hypothetical protein [archaeon]
MTSKTSILLIIQQNPGMDYQSLLSKIAPNYSNLNSARAALSRVLKDAVSFGMVQRRDHQLFLTDKGMASLKVKMHDKLVLKLNQLMQTRGLGHNPDALVQHLSILLERGKQDQRLLDNARASVNFSVADIDKVKQFLSTHIQHLHYLEKTLDHQVASLKELNFPSAHKLSLEEMRPLSGHLLTLSNTPEVQVEPALGITEAAPVLPILEGLDPISKGTRFTIASAHFPTILTRLAQLQDGNFPGMKAYLGLFSLDLHRENVVIRGPSHLMERLLNAQTQTPPQNAMFPVQDPSNQLPMPFSPPPIPPAHPIQPDQPPEEPPEHEPAPPPEPPPP